MTNPAADPIGTVRVHPDHERENPSSLRRIKVDATDHAGPYVGCHWARLTFHPQSPTMAAGCDPVSDDDVADWTVQSLAELATILGHPAPCTDHVACHRCAPNWGKDAAAPEPVEDTDTPCWDCKGNGCAKCSAAPSAMDSIRERIARVIDGILEQPNGLAYRGTLPDALLAALPELAEHAELQRTHGCVCHNPNGGMFTWPCPQHSERVHLANEVKQLRAETLRAADAIDRVANERDFERGRAAELAKQLDHARTEIAELEKLRAERNNAAHREAVLREARDTYRGDARHYRGLWYRATAANTKLLDDPKTATAAENADLRAKLAQRNKEYGRASATIAHHRGELARTTAALEHYRNLAAQLSAEAKATARKTL